MTTSLLVHACARARGLPHSHRLDPGFDENRLPALARYHKITDELRTGLSRMPGVVSEEIMRAISRQVLAGRAFRAMVLTDWAHICRAFADSGVRTLTLKGPAASLQLYGDAYARGYGDLDLLVHPRDMTSAAAVMKSLGWEPMPVYRTRPEVRWASTVHHIPFEKVGRPFPVEVHERLWKVEESRRELSFDDLYDRSVPVAHEDREYLTLSPVDHAVFQFMHGSSHAWCLLRWIVDAATLLQDADDTLKDDIMYRCEELGVSHLAALAVRVVSTLFPAADAGEWHRRTGRCSKTAVYFAVARVRDARGRPTSMPALVRYFIRYRLSIAKTPKSKAAVVARLLMVNNADVATLKLPKSLSFLYLPLRPTFVLARRLKRFFEKMGRRGHA